MAARFEPLPGDGDGDGPGGGGAALALDPAELSILRSLVVQLLELVGPGGSADAAPGGEVDPLEALFAEGPTEPPADPALARLLPDAYGGPGEAPDEETRRWAAEFRRFTEPDLRARKREDGLAVVRSLDAVAADGSVPGGGGVVRLDAEGCRRWLGTLNDLRLAVGARLGIEDDDTSERIIALPDDDPRKPMAMAYLWLGFLQESLLETLMT
ncbi:DUF2017 domain-containing protein [Streptomyces sp. ST2-7A]|uniref:DUF2017 domain-containing protein n=1 Tax=Streptomyces sp. ST2-7A TaxID=2907214 RepID=UPI001F3879CE|nr:DUF2017 domain-containing protein [Streptomyces sp. ST2-7A]MCE7082552.1 DUF2017 domain-containing protein [Streptomyces sp. ST2-7A]